jgi:hypothetical protein
MILLCPSCAPYEHPPIIRTTHYIITTRTKKGHIFYCPYIQMASKLSQNEVTQTTLLSQSSRPCIDLHWIWQVSSSWDDGCRGRKVAAIAGHAASYSWTAATGNTHAGIDDKLISVTSTGAAADPIVTAAVATTSMAATAANAAAAATTPAVGATATEAAAAADASVAAAAAGAAATAAAAATAGAAATLAISSPG